MDVERCVSCGEIIPEGRQTCLICDPPLTGYTSYGFIGLVDGKLMMFATDDEYYEYLREEEKDDVRIKR